MQKLTLAAAALAALMVTPVHAADDETALNIYSARGEATDENLYNDFMEASGLHVNRSERDTATTLQRLADESAAQDEENRDAHADVVLLNGLANLHAAAAQGLLQPLKSQTLEQAVPEKLRAKTNDDGATPWFGLSRRARVIVYDPDQIDAGDVQTYEQLADVRHKGELCMTAASDAANQGLLAALIAHNGSKKAEDWLRGVNDNLAVTAGGSDTDQIKAVAAGKCKITLSYHFDVTQLMRSDEAADRDIARSVVVVFPNQDSWGTHVDVAGVALARHAPHAEQAQAFMDYLVSEQGQNLFANSNDEWPVVKDYRFDNERLQALLGKQDSFKSDDTPLGQIAAHLDEARKLTGGAAPK